MENAEPLNKDCQFLCVSVKDDEREDITKYISQINDFVHEGRSKGIIKAPVLSLENLHNKISNR